ncbi:MULTISPECIES: nucleoside phosphorylase [unclassified Aureispira]|uniref:nucleoside phosphorylase n=1 Tax=unclassified Aureispira TaxID=2649989 RepID=UPI000698F729|nr:MULTISPECIES: nucleoside phosphorylase [unclassified Aureispira]WMX17499.1 nucleoside phosphorylase [Aureispira sp. CCB-E]
MEALKDANLIINPDGSIYHLGIRPEDIAETIILVGDPQRVKKVAAHFDSIELTKQKREFITTTGRIGNQRITCLASGIGVDNIDIVVNELDALVNVDFKTRTFKEEHTALKLIRLGTSGAIRKDIPVESFVVADYGIGFDGLMLFYKQYLNERTKGLKRDFNAFLDNLNFDFPIPPTYSSASQSLIDLFQAPEWKHGITATATGFYAPQNRTIRAESIVPELFDLLEPFSYDNLNVTNLEMETSAIYGLASVLGHKALALNVILANRPTGAFATAPKELEKKLIRSFFEVYLGA